MINWHGEAAASYLTRAHYYCHNKNSKTANFSIRDRLSREISIPVTRKNGVTAYINRYSTIGLVFPICGIDGIVIEELYPIGYKGRNGNPGIAGSVARHNPSLDPKNNEVLRLHVHDEGSLEQLLAWYRS